MISWRPLLRAIRRGTIGVAITVALLLAPGPSPAQADTHTVVSLEFDDGWQDATVAAALLSAHGMHGTFFVISGLLGNPNRLTLADLHQLAADGNEIGGHTVDHPHLTTLSADDQQREICNDRLALLGDGFAVTDLAYPYGQFDATTEQVAAMCGYNSAREVGGAGCAGCPAGEAIPPPDPYRTRTEPGATSTTPVETLEGYVTQAEQNGGGWVQIVFHQICDGCGIYGVTADELSQFLDWLAPRAADGTTTATVSQVIGGGVKPAVAGPPITSPGAGIVPNPGFEADSDQNGVPDCWYLAGFGTNTYTWTRTTNAHTGGYAERLDITSWTSGDRKAITTFDHGTCAPTVTPGTTYHADEWFTSTAPVRFVAYTRDTNGTWTFWAKSPFTPAAATWTQAHWTPPPIPTGTTALSIGLSLAGTGTATFDDLDVAPPQNLLPNPGFEADSDQNGVPDCWYLAGFGTNTYTWTRTTNAHTGGYAERLDITSWTSGDRKAITTFDHGTCAPTVTPGTTYHADEWFTSTAPVRFVAYTRDTNGTWTFWAKSPFTPAAATWTQAHWTPPPIPTGTTALSIGLSLAGTGTATFDDAQLTE